MSEMIERVARAIAWQDGYAWGQLPEDASEGDDQLGYLDMARAAIEAMREMTPAMRDAWQAQRGDPSYGHMLIETVVADHWWPNAIDAALT